MLSAMATTLALVPLLLLALALLVLVVLVVRTVRLDGYGRRPAPRSHPSWDEGMSTEH